ncbi:MAG: hypothetical protein M1831_006792 [Alyxoria varia]|nr:MAG: hypothetical protein M1831_006792 [Alyxoria varia]
MNGTPRLRSAYPATTSTIRNRRSPLQNGTPPSGSTASSSSFQRQKLPDMRDLNPPEPEVDESSFPYFSIDAPTQRKWAFIGYIILFFWRLYDFYHLTIDETESFWLFIKWVAFDGVFLYTIPVLRIPWLEWSSTMTTGLYFAHVLFDWALMFRIHVSVSGAFIALLQVLWHKELAISEYSVKPANILNNPSLILGKQIIHILPEGSARLNPDQIPICLDPTTRYADAVLPIQINQTTPISIELIRYDFDSPKNQSVQIPASQIRKLRKDAEKVQTPELHGALILNYMVRKPGLYRLGRVIDETKMEVSHKQSETLVLQCPTAKVKAPAKNKCRGDLSNIAIEVEGTPPLKLKYRKTVNTDERDVTYQSIQPDGFTSPLVRWRGAGPLTQVGEVDFSWAAPSRVMVPVNETLLAGGVWSYAVERVEDAMGNMVMYTEDDEESEQSRPVAKDQEGSFTVHDRPAVGVQDYNRRTPFMAAEGHSVALPLRFGISGSTAQPMASRHLISYEFTPHNALLASGDHSINSTFVNTEVAGPHQSPHVKNAGLYTLKSVSSEHCSGEIVEPASFLLVNPPRPDLHVESHPIVDQCANRPTGMRVELDMTGTPPFEIKYTMKESGHDTGEYTHTFHDRRDTLILKPNFAAKYSYKIYQISDSIYPAVPLKEPIRLNQEVKPAASASFIGKEKHICKGQSAEFDVNLLGEKPWKLEHEFAIGSKRTKHKLEGIETPYPKIKTGQLAQGGEHSVILNSVTDAQGCREALQKVAKVFVRHQAPKGGFGLLEGKRSIKTLESKVVDLPLRLSGEGPWTIDYAYVGEDGIQVPMTKRIIDANAFLPVNKPGTYEITSVKDSMCPGSPDDATSKFEVQWIGRPRISVPPSPLMAITDRTAVRKEVCQGDDDAMEISFSGRPPYDVKYQERIIPDSGQKSLKNSELNVPMHSAQIKLDTSRAGQYDYVFSELGDYNYDHDSRNYRPFTIKQRVHGRPGATFSSPGKVYSFCQQKEDLTASTRSEAVPMTFSGKPPFTVDLEIRLHSRASKPQTLSIPNIPSTSHDLQIPHRLLQPGTSQLLIRRVRDQRGCETLYDTLTPLTGGRSGNVKFDNSISANTRVQISVHDPPTLSPADPDRTHYCVGEYVSYALSGAAPFTVYYTFEGTPNKATVHGTTFRRIAEQPGKFAITGLQDSASPCVARLDGKTVSTRGVDKVIHGMPQVRVSKGKETVVDIHAGGEAEISFEFVGVAPFEFTYTRSANAPYSVGQSKGKKGSSSSQQLIYGGDGISSRDVRPGDILETKTLTSEARSLNVMASEEGTYEVVAVQDRYCRYVRGGMEGLLGGVAGGSPVLARGRGVKEEERRLPDVD